VVARGAGVAVLLGQRGEVFVAALVHRHGVPGVLTVRHAEGVDRAVLVHQGQVEVRVAGEEFRREQGGGAVPPPGREQLGPDEGFLLLPGQRQGQPGQPAAAALELPPLAVGEPDPGHRQLPGMEGRPRVEPRRAGQRQAG
jgi:hypothetical protein